MDVLAVVAAMNQPASAVFTVVPLGLFLGTLVGIPAVLARNGRGASALFVLSALMFSLQAAVTGSVAATLTPPTHVNMLMWILTAALTAPAVLATRAAWKACRGLGTPCFSMTVFISQMGASAVAFVVADAIAIEWIFSHYFHGVYSTSERDNHH